MPKFSIALDPQRFANFIDFFISPDFKYSVINPHKNVSPAPQTLATLRELLDDVSRSSISLLIVSKLVVNAVFLR